ncbi:MAG: bifunctional UDP-N-acetylmuramoyl-tripeptide:D-alanyl-D-alanine ligase/alanine racemase [Chitinophagaceae bacterium]
MVYSLQHIAKIIQANIIGDMPPHASIQFLVTDSRKIVFPEQSIFFALPGAGRDGHSFIDEVYQRGVTAFVVSKPVAIQQYSNAVFLMVTNTLHALQQLAAYHRKQFQYPVIAITGSNGKTIVKEWLYQLLQSNERIVRSPRSYNSQIGVPLSLWQLSTQHTMAIIEAGISEQGEMQALRQMIAPTAAIFTTLGAAHSAGFENLRHKATEKWQLLTGVGKQYVHADTVAPHLPQGILSQPQVRSFGKLPNCTLHIQNVQKQATGTTITASYQNALRQITIPFTDDASINNACCCWLFLLDYGMNDATIAERMLQLTPVNMRLQLTVGVHQSYLINDSYSNDVSSLTIALDYLQQQAGAGNKIVVLSDVLQAGIPAAQLYTEIGQLLQQFGIRQCIGIGTAIGAHRAILQAYVPQCLFFDSITALQQSLTTQHFQQAYVLLKGARQFQFETLHQWLQLQSHQTRLDIHLGAMQHNLQQFRQLLTPGTKLMAVVKAYGYGSGSAEVGRLLQFQKVDYLAVAYADEGVQLRKAGISLPILVLNIDAAAFDALVTYQLEPEIFSFGILQQFIAYLQQQAIESYPIHIKLDTGMHRLGFESKDIQQLTQILATQSNVVIKSVFSHLAASDAAEHDAFTVRQIALFQEMIAAIQKVIPYTFLQHIGNSAAIERHSEWQLSMVRLGIGLYGVAPYAASHLQLQPVARLYTTIAQIRNVAAGETVGYNRRGVVAANARIATIRIGYADGFSRQLSNGVGKVWLHGKLAPVIGTVCMDMTMIDVTNIPEAQENDEVEIFGTHLPVQQHADWCNTIAYEILTSIGLRVPRVYITE